MMDADLHSPFAHVAQPRDEEHVLPPISVAPVLCSAFLLAPAQCIPSVCHMIAPASAVRSIDAGTAQEMQSAGCLAAVALRSGLVLYLHTVRDAPPERAHVALEHSEADSQLEECRSVGFLAC